MPTLTIKGLASQSVVKTIETRDEELKFTLLEFLQDHQVPIASSCFGDGACKRCIVNHHILSCQITVEKFIELNPDLEIKVSYL